MRGVFRNQSHIYDITSCENSYKYIHINTWIYSKVDFKKPMSGTYSEFGQTWKIKVFAKIVNAFEYNGVVSRRVSKCFPCKIYEV